jgi:diacylglycerol kinase (ATP)
MSEREPFTVAARLRSFRCALRGVEHTLLSQHNAWIHAVATVAACGLGLLLGLSKLEWCAIVLAIAGAIVLAIAGVWTAEALNTALEFLCDVASPEFHPRVQKAKDVAAAGVLIAAVGAVVIGLLVFGPPLLRMLG